MGRAEHRETWKKTSHFILFLLFCLPVWTASAQVSGHVGSQSNQSVTCQSDEFKSKKGHCCNKCPPGFRLEAECTAYPLRSNCIACLSGYYQELTNHFGNCFSCKICNPDMFEKELSPCTGKKNRECGCQDDYEKKDFDPYNWECRVRKNVSEGKATIKPNDNSEHNVPFLVVAAAFAAVIIVVIWFMIYKNHRRCQRGSTKLPVSSPTENACKTGLISHTSGVDSFCQESDFRVSPVSCVLDKTEIPNLPVRLPDCVPQEIKPCQFIYFVLRLIPADRFKELVRRLDISERDIERAERDNRSFSDFQYQMLNMWSEGGSGGTLSRPLIAEMVNKLEEMGLRACAEAIEEEYDIQ